MSHSKNSSVANKINILEQYKRGIILSMKYYFSFGMFEPLGYPQMTNICEIPIKQDTVWVTAVFEDTKQIPQSKLNLVAMN